MVMTENRSATVAVIKVEGLEKWFGEYQALKDINLSVQPGEKIVICGPSGSGKSTLIRCFNQLEQHQKGRITVDGTELVPGSRANAAATREIGMVFQQFNLFPHMTVLENCVLAPMEVRHISRSEAEAVAMDYLTKVRFRIRRRNSRCSFPVVSNNGSRLRARFA